MTSVTLEPSTEDILLMRITRWDRAVRWVRDRPETLDYYEFIDLLDQRDSLAVALTDAVAGGGSQAHPGVSALDAEFVAATRPISSPIDPRPRADAQWWRLRVPRVLGQDFRRSVEEHFPEVAEEIKRRPDGPPP